MRCLTSKPFRDLLDALRAPCAFGIDDGDTALCASLVLGQLGDHGHGVRELGLATTCSNVSEKSTTDR